MPNNNDPNRPDDNPFIAFRRFADSQVSSILNTVFTLPATLAHYNVAHQAREQCLFGKADKRECDKLQQLEGEIARLRDEGRASYRVGDLQDVLEKSEDLLVLTQRADQVRRSIVEAATGQEGSGNGERALVEKVGNEKGQQWGDSWDWDIPKRDGDADDSDLYAKMIQMEAQMKKFLFGDRGLDVEPRRWRGEDGHQSEDARSRLQDSQPHTASWLWQWPSPGDTLKKDAASNDSLQDVFDELGQVMRSEARRILRHPSASTSDNSYSPESLSQNPALRESGIDWQAAYEELLRTEQQRQTHEGANYSSPKSPQYPKNIPWEDSQSSQDPPSSYARDHNDQHEEPPSPRAHQTHFTNTRSSEQSSHTDASNTELDMYEQLLAPPQSHNLDANNQLAPSVLSTMTTTERTVAPDGSVTTKILLKKRFADGREESSETVHTQRGETAREMWKDPGQKRESKDEKRGGWFWSS